jgi:hypothetical protein
MAQDTEHVTRKFLHLRVPVYPDEAQEIRRNATAAGKSVAAYLRAVGMGYRILTALDHRRIDDMLRVNGDLGRLGGLLKLWLTNDDRTEAFGEATIRALLAKIEDTQAELLAVIRSVEPPRSAH